MSRIPDWAKTAILVVVLLLGAVVLFFACSMVIGGSVAVSNFKEAHQRATVARTMSNHRTIHTAIEAYKNDNGQLPPSLHALTSPMAYISQGGTEGVFGDDFAEGQITQYFTLGGDFVLTSVGPDRDQDIKSADELRGGLSGLVLKAYDATNGSVSDGDVYRYGQGR